MSYSQEQSQEDLKELFENTSLTPTEVVANLVDFDIVEMFTRYTGPEEGEEIVCMIDWLHRYELNKRWDVLNRARQVAVGGLRGKMERDGLTAIKSFEVSLTSEGDRRGVKVVARAVK